MIIIKDNISTALLNFIGKFDKDLFAAYLFRPELDQYNEKKKILVLIRNGKIRKECILFSRFFSPSGIYVLLS